MLASIHTHSSARCSRVCRKSCSSWWVGRMWRSLVICVLQHSSMGVFGSALCAETGRGKTLCSHLHCVLLLLQPSGTHSANCRAMEGRKRSKVAPTLLYIKKDETYSSTEAIPPLLPSLSPFPHKHAHIYYRRIQKGVASKKSMRFSKRAKKLTFYLSFMQSLFPFLFRLLTEITEIWFFYESYSRCGWNSL